MSVGIKNEKLITCFGIEQYFLYEICVKAYNILKNDSILKVVLYKTDSYGHKIPDMFHNYKQGTLLFNKRINDLSDFWRMFGFLKQCKLNDFGFNSSMEQTLLKAYYISIFLSVFKNKINNNEIVEVTIGEIAKLKGVSVDKIRIK